MSDELGTAFGHPEARAAAMAGPDPLDRILLLDHVVEAEIGAFEAERGLHQRLRFNIVVEVRPPGDAADDVDRILSYDRLAEAVAAELASERLSLLETLAERTARRILREPQAERVFLRVAKLDRGPGDLGVEIVRSRGSFAEFDAPEAPRPRVVVLDEEAAQSNGLARTIGALIEAEAPLLLVAPSAPAPGAATEEAQRRVDLLAADQGAWLLAALDERLSVAATRTELDWHLRRRRPVVWAPSKIVLDEGWAGRDGASCAAAVAALLGAVELVLIGADDPDEARVPVRRATLDRPLG